jgi:thioredoxin reductase (NADPH)
MQSSFNSLKSNSNSLMVGIVGGGVAGMSCALWLKHLGFTPVIIEQNTQLGGQLLHLDRINRWVLGSPDKTSVELAGIYAAHIKQEAIAVLYQARLLEAKAQSSGFDLLIDEAGKPRSLSVLAVVIATGLRVLGLDVFRDITGFHALNKTGLMSFFPLDHLEKLPQLKGKTVAVIGGGDNAHYTAKDIAQAGAQVYLLMRSSSKARTIIRNEVEGLIKQGHIIKRTGTSVQAFQQDKGKIEITLLGEDGTEEKINVDRIFARIGFAANSEFLDAYEAFSGMVKEAGYIKTDANKRTSVPWVYAIGDVANGKHQSVVNAIADGAIAAQDLSDRV